MSKEESQQFVFEQLQKVFIQDKNHIECLFKWGLDKTMELQSFRFNLNFKELEAKQFINDFLNDKSVQSTLQSLSLYGNIKNFSYDQLKCSTTNMNLFDRLETEGLTARGSIKGTYDDYVDDIHIQSLLLEMLIKEESEFYEVYSKEDKNQFLFKIFYHLIIGGSMSQPDDKIDNYLAITKNLYKNMVWQLNYISARKDQGSNNIFIDSFVYKIDQIEVIF